MADGAAVPAWMASTEYSGLARGRYEDALAMIGFSTPPERAEVPVELGQIKAFAALVEDGNECYWDPEVSQRWWGAQVAPAGILIALDCPLHWTPKGTPPTVLAGRVPLPGRTMINSRSEQTFHRSLRLGDWLSVVQTLDAVSPLKETRLGRGHFVVTTARYSVDGGELVAESVNTMFRFDPHADGADR